MEELKTKLKEILIEEIKIQGITPAEIRDDMPLFGDGLGLDSLDAVELVVLIQKHFDVQIANMDEGKEAFVSIESLARYINERKDKGLDR
jgi:acyl carrier protein